MKHIVCLILAFCLLVSGCSLSGDQLKEPVTFYYVRAAYPFTAKDSVLASEEREASGHRDDLTYLLALYLIGPTDEELVSPIPKGTRFYSAEVKDGIVYLNMSDTAATLTDNGFTIACACLTLTCIGLTGAETVTITSGDRKITMTADMLILYDIPTETTEVPHS